MPGPGNPNNGKDPRGESGETKNQINLAETGLGPGVFFDLDEDLPGEGNKKLKNVQNKVVIGTTDDPDTLGDDEGTGEPVEGDDLDNLLADIAAGISGGDDFGEGEAPGADDLRTILADKGVLDEGESEGDTADDTAELGDVVALGDGNDQMWAGSGNDVVLGQFGNDVIRGEAGNDILFGGAGNDVLDGGEGDDFMDGGTGDDEIHVDSENDMVDGGAGEDTVVIDVFDEDGKAKVGDFDDDDIMNVEAWKLGAGGVTLAGTAGNDNLVGNDDDNTIIGGEGDDTIDGKGGNDTLIGDGGPDGDDTINGGTGNDTIYGDNVDGSEDTGAGTWDDTLFGDEGDDVIVGGDGGDAIDGGDGSDTASYENADDMGVTVDLSSAGEQDVGSGSDADGDTLADIENLIGSAFDDTLTGDDNANTIDGGAGNDTISGGDGADELNGEAGDDIIEGGIGGDTIDGGDGNDTASYANSAAPVTVDLGADTAAGGDAQGDDLDNIENLIGSAGNDTLTGDSGDNVIDGGAGADTISGGDGADELNGEAGDDLIEGGIGGDMIDGGDGADTLSGGAGGDTDLFDLGLTSGDDDDPSFLSRDNFQDVVVAQADFGANGTDNVVHYSDGQNDETTDFAFDVIDFTALLGEDGDPDNILFVKKVDTDTQIWEDANNDDTITDSTVDNQWFSLSEEPGIGANPPENVFIQVGDDIFKWNDSTDVWDAVV